MLTVKGKKKTEPGEQLQAHFIIKYAPNVRVVRSFRSVSSDVSHTCVEGVGARPASVWGTSHRGLGGKDEQMLHFLCIPPAVGVRTLQLVLQSAS